METKKDNTTVEGEPNPQCPSLQNPSATPHTSPSIPSRARGESIDTDEVSDNDGATAVRPTSGENIEDVVGFSIGHEQLRMKSPETPAFEKTKALNQSKDYFDLGPEDEESYEGDTSPDTYQDFANGSIVLHAPFGERTLERPEDQRPAARASPEDPLRSNASRSILKDGLGPRIRRASSESTGMVGALRKLLPDLPSISFPKPPALSGLGFGSKSKGDNQFKRTSAFFSRGSLPWLSPDPSSSPVITPAETTEGPIVEGYSPAPSPLVARSRSNANGMKRDSRTDFHESDLLSSRSVSNRRLLRRATSDNSLFIRNDLHRTTTQDDADKWANVSEQINSRFKAITDSLQDSAISRLPKMPSVSLGSFKPGPQRTNSDTARLNKDRNAILTQNDASTGDSGLQGPSPPYPIKSPKHVHPILNQAVSDLTGDIVVLGGYRGSILRSAKPPNKQLWVPVKVRVGPTILLRL
jgi:hypothetical protein